jgi:N-acetylmuramic acid 6-phosphate etherase
MRPWSSKLRERSKRIIMELTGVDYKKADAAFEEAGRDLKSALVMVETGATPDEAGKLLKSADGHVFKAIELRRSLQANTRAAGEQ